MFDMTTTSDTVTYYKYNCKIQCEKCEGTGYQQRDAGIFVVCPICGGSGWRDVEKEQKYEPYVPCEPTPWYPTPWKDGPTYMHPSWRKYTVTC